MVISAGEQAPIWFAMQEELATLSSDSIYRVVEGADHGALLYDEHDARASGAAIQQVVEAARADRPLGR